ncbi:MAG TPA: DegV family protein [Ruminococcaceae bacterium]|jgi:DegV family protein with EDD domain|nr:DegV family protein [Oscillospiraceae bacterium]
MKIQLIVDSCCDLTPELKEKLVPDIAPLTIRLAGSEYLDDGTVDVAAMLDEMAASKQGASSACPSSEDYAEHMRKYDQCFVVTLSSKLSGSYNAARIAAEMVMEEFPDKKIYVFDSKTASAGELQLALFLHEKIEQGLSFDEIVVLGEEFIDSLRTMFVVEDLGNLIRNGRLSKVSGLIASVLSLCPIMGENGQGDIKLVAKVRGIQNSLRKLVELVSEHTSNAAANSLRLVLSYCHCPERATALKTDLMEKCNALREVILVSTGALSSMYANKGGVVIAFSSAD